MNWKWRAILFVSLLMVQIATGIPPAPAQETLSGAHIKKNFPGTYELVIYGFDIGVRASRGGGLQVTFLGDTLKGTWSVKGEQLCITLTDGKETESECSTLQYDGKKYYSAGGIRFYEK